MSRVLIARMDNAGDVLLAGPCVRAAAARDEVFLLVGPNGHDAADMLPGVTETIEWCAPWIDLQPPDASADHVEGLLKQVRDIRPDRALILTSFHQSPLPLALVLRMAGVPWIAGISDDYPGSLLDLRHRIHGDPPEAERALSLAHAAGYRLPVGDDGRLRVNEPLPPTAHLAGRSGYVVVHPGASAPARMPSTRLSRDIVTALVDAGNRVVVTGSVDELELTYWVAGSAATDLGGRTDLAQLASVFRHARVVVAPNTAAAHLAAAVGTPVVSLFAPVVPAARWAPYKVPSVVLGDQRAPCRDSRARICPVGGHPCLESIEPSRVVMAVGALGGGRLRPRAQGGGL